MRIAFELASGKRREEIQVRNLDYARFDSNFLAVVPNSPGRFARTGSGSLGQLGEFPGPDVEGGVGGGT